MICYDVHWLPKKLAAKKADIVLYSVGWFGPNEKHWFTKRLPRQSVIPYGYNLIVANWTSPSEDKVWPGRGFSCIITDKGEIPAISESATGTAIVTADLQVQHKHTQ
jgi:hypothetical protein